MPENRQAPAGHWLDRLFAERQVYVRGRGQPHFVTVSSRARLVRALAVLLLIVTVAGLCAALAWGYQRYTALDRELAALRSGAPAPAKPQAVAAAPDDELRRLRQTLEAERAGRAHAEADLAQERAAGQTASHARDAELEAARARVALLTSQVQSADQARGRAEAEAKAAAAKAPAPQQQAAAEQTQAVLDKAAAGAREQSAVLAAAQAEAGSLRSERDGLQQQLVSLRQQLDAPKEEAPAGPGEATAVAAITAAKDGQDLRASLDASQARVRELEAQVAELSRRSAALETYLGRRAPAAPAAAPR